MHATPSIHTTAQAATAAATPGRRVIDAPTRMFHWLFALSFLGAYLTADGESWRLLHVTLGYTLAGLLVFRVLYGLLGPRQAGLGLMWRKLAGAPAWLRSLTQSRSLADINWRQGQNLLMALAVVALLLMVLPLTLSGYATYNDWGDFLGGDWLEEVHEFFGEAFLFVVLAHMALIAGLSLLRRKNQALPMLTGRIAGKGPDLVQKNRVWLAALLLLAVLAYGGWEWQQSPNGLISSKTWNDPATGQAHDED
ncbi:MAG: cytochrome b/b6 domain-containing protein [Polaromonas sp.]|nr:cytochrome b/b6 domain-containing protein [Polaromonas sp.]